MSFAEVCSAVSLAVVFVAVFAAWVWLGGLSESGAWEVPEAALHLLDWMAKATSGAFLTVLIKGTRSVPRPGPTRSVTVSVTPMSSQAVNDETGSC